jgi:hypothetical protein
MSKRTRVRAISAIGAGAVVVALGAVTVNASAAENSGPAQAQAEAGAEFVRTAAPAAPPVLKPPVPVKLLGAEFVASGTQTYTCANGSFAGASVPEAQLLGTLGRIHHYGGPTWESNRTRTKVTAKKIAESPRAGTIPELLLQVDTSTGQGLLGKTRFIQRLLTSGGVAPARACTDGEKAAVPYGAIYVFLG